MKVKILKGFGANVAGEMVSYSEGQVVDLPAGADFVRAGLAEPLEGEVEDAAVAAPAPETAMLGPAETAVPKAPRKRKPK